jgi:hypothetical protein
MMSIAPSVRPPGTRAFTGLEKIISARSRSGSIGFGAKVMAPEDRKQGEIFRDVDLAPIGLAAGLTFGFPLSFGRPMGVESSNATVLGHH